MISNKKIQAGLLGMILVLSFLPAQIGLAQDESILERMTNSAQKTSTSSGLSKDGSMPTDIRVTVAKMVKNLMTLLGTIAVVLIIYAGFLWMTAGGNEEQISKAKKLITNAVIGLIIILMAYSIAGFVIDRLTGAGAPAAPQPTTIF